MRGDMVGDSENGNTESPLARLTAWPLVHWGSRGLTQGGSANDLPLVVLDLNVQIQESKAATCDIYPGWRGS